MNDNKPQVGLHFIEVGVADYMPGVTGFTMGCFKAADVPKGSKLYILVEIESKDSEANK